MKKIKEILGSIDVARWLGVLAAYLWAGVRKIRNSLVAFVGSPKVWLAAAMFTLAGYWAGHLVMAGKVRSLDVTAQELVRDKASLSNRIDELSGRNRDLAQKLADAMKPPAVASLEQPTPPIPAPPTKPKKVKVPVKQEGSFWAIFQ